MPFVTARDATLFVTEVGPPDAPPILFSNSLGTTHRMWDAVVAELASDFRCIRYDTRGHGASTLSTTRNEIADLADDAAAILDNLGVETIHFAGLSLGAMTGQVFAVRHPGRLRSLILMATASSSHGLSVNNCPSASRPDTGNSALRPVRQIPKKARFGVSTYTAPAK